jgi:hypothetical protein
LVIKQNRYADYYTIGSYDGGFIKEETSTQEDIPKVIYTIGSIFDNVTV